MRDPLYKYKTLFLISLPAVLLFLFMFIAFLYLINVAIDNPPDPLGRYW
jgi:hypothetical protein